MSSRSYADRAGRVEGVGVPGFSHLDERLNAVRAFIAEQLRSRSGSEKVAQLIDHVCSGSGKMLRPGLVMAAGEVIGPTSDKHIVVGGIVEMIHNATLLHDDVIDQGQKRRGLPTVNRLWDNESAVLLGDFMLSQVFKITGELDAETSRVIAGTTATVCEGELRQVTEKHNWRLNEAEYIDIITEKSASLLSSCCYLGALHSGASKQECESLAEFGLQCGIAFQIADDILDITGDEGKMGKSVGSDFDMEKPTLALIHYIRQAGEKERSDIERMLDGGLCGSRDVGQLLLSAGCVDYARRKAEEYVNRGLDALSDLKGGDERDLLAQVAKFMVYRAS